EDAMRRDRVDRALAWWSSWLRVEPLDEPVVGSFLRHCRAGGRAAEGVRTFDAFRTRLERELGFEPTDELTAMAYDLRQASGSSEENVASPSCATWSPATTRTAASTRQPYGALAVALSPRVGSTEELERLLHALRSPGA